MFFTLLAFIGDRFKSIVIKNSDNFSEIISNSFYYMIYPLIATIGYALLFSIPFYFAFRVKKAIYFIFTVLSILTAEYFIYSYVDSPSDFRNGIYNGVLTLLFLTLFFYKKIILFFKLD